MRSVDGKFSLAANVTKVSGDDLADSAWNMGPKKAQLNYSSGSDNFTFEVRADAGWAKRAFVSVELQKQSSGSSFANGEFFEIKVGDQPIGFDVRYVSGGSSPEAELGYWLMAEQKTVADGDFVMDGVTVWSKSGNTITFDSGVSVWDPQKMNTATSADISNDGHYNFDITITASSKTYMVWIDVQGGSPVVGFEKMQFVANTGGMGGGGMGGGGMGGGNPFSNWVPLMNTSVPMEWVSGISRIPVKSCSSVLYLNKRIRHSYLDQISLTKNDDKTDDGGGSYAFDNSSSAGIRRSLSVAGRILPLQKDFNGSDLWCKNL